MTLLFRSDRTACRDDLATVEGGYTGLDAMLSTYFDEWIKHVEALIQRQSKGDQPKAQFFNPFARDHSGLLFEVPIVWNAFPKALVNLFGRDKAMVVADLLWPVETATHFDPLSPGWSATRAAATEWCRPQSEYCEWRVERDAATQRIRRVVFTVESPEYWSALFDRAGPEFVAGRYSELLGTTVPAGDLSTNGRYKPDNRWNTTHGIVHLARDDNALQSAIALCAYGAVPLRHVDRSPITGPEELCCCMGDTNGSRFGADGNRNSDTAVASTVNALARSGARVTLAGPIGLAISEVDTRGWQLPSGIDPRECLRIVRGAPGRILRLVVETPVACGHLIDELSIAGVPLLYGGQIAECMTIRTRVACTRPGVVTPIAIAPMRRGYVLAGSPRRLWSKPADQGLLPGQIAAFSRLRFASPATAAVPPASP